MNELLRKIQLFTKKHREITIKIRKIPSQRTIREILPRTALAAGKATREIMRITGEATRETNLRKTKMQVMTRTMRKKRILEPASWTGIR